MTDDRPDSNGQRFEPGYFELDDHTVAATALIGRFVECMKPDGHAVMVEINSALELRSSNDAQIANWKTARNLKCGGRREENLGPDERLAFDRWVEGWAKKRGVAVSELWVRVGKFTVRKRDDEIVTDFLREKATKILALTEPKSEQKEIPF